MFYVFWDVIVLKFHSEALDSLSFNMSLTSANTTPNNSYAHMTKR